MFAAAGIVAVDFTLHDIGPVEGLFSLAPGRAFRQVSGVVKQRLWFSHRCHPYKKKPAVAGFIVYIFFALLPIIVRLTQQRAALALETLSVIAKPMFDFTEAVDKRLLIALLQQANRFAETLVIALNQRQVIFR